MISMIAAVARGNVIGGGNRLLWHIPDDLKHFKAITLGHPVVMGRKTFESLGKALPGRTNVVITRNPDYLAPGCTIVDSLQEAVALFDPGEEVFVIGGGEIYTQGMPLARRLYITEVDADYDGDTLFPEIDPALWRQTLREPHPEGPIAYTFVEYSRK